MSAFFSARSVGAALAALALTLVVSAPAQADAPRTYRFVYTLGEGTARCPARDQIMGEISGRLVRDPWDPAARSLITVTIGLQRQQLQALISVRERGSRKAGQRRFTSASGDCKELVEHVAFHLSLYIDPLSPGTPRRKAAPPAPAPRPAPVKVARRPTRRRPRSRRPRFSISAGGLLALGSAPGHVAGGVAVQGRLRWSRVSVALEARVDLPAYADVQGGQVSSFLTAAAVIPCLHHRWFSGCGVLSAGAMRGQGHGLNDAMAETSPHLMTGVRANGELRLRGIFSLRMYADLLLQLTRNPLKETATDVELWSNPPVHGALGLAVVGDFF